MHRNPVIIRPNKKTVRQANRRPIVPQVLPPMDRPVTPHSDIRGTSSSTNSEIIRLLETEGDLEGLSEFDSVITYFQTSSSQEDVDYAVNRFAAVAEKLEGEGRFSASDFRAYRQLDQFLHIVAEKSPGKTLICLVKGLESCIGAMGSKELFHEIREAFYQFIAKVLYKMSSQKENDCYFQDQTVISKVISLTFPERNKHARSYAAATLKNETQDPKFRGEVIRAADFDQIYRILDEKPRNLQLLEQIIEFFRFVIQDAQNTEILKRHAVPMKLFEIAFEETSTKEIVYNCFRILTKVSEDDLVRKSVLERFGPEAVFGNMVDLLVSYKAEQQILIRVGCVLADFEAYEPSVVETAKTSRSRREGSSVVALCGLLDQKNEAVQKNPKCAAMMVQIITNLAVNKDCSDIISKACSGSLVQMLQKAVFEKGDRLSLNLLCTASNLTCHDSSWCPQELIDVIPKAIVSQDEMMIIEAVRCICNLALSPNKGLIESQIPELLGILLRHPNPDVALLSLQSLANLVLYPEIKPRFRKQECLGALQELMKEDELDEAKLQAISVIVMNFGEITKGEAKAFYDLLDEFQLDPQDEITSTFEQYLQHKM